MKQIQVAEKIISDKETRNLHLNWLVDWFFTDWFGVTLVNFDNEYINWCKIDVLFIC